MKSYFVDTNYFLRFLIKSNSAQFQKAYDLFQKGAVGEITLVSSTIVFFEIYWVLASFYNHSKDVHTQILANVLKMDFVDFKERESLMDALKLYKRSTIELEDCYNIVYAKQQHCNSLASFDKKLQQKF